MHYRRELGNTGASSEVLPSSVRTVGRAAIILQPRIHWLALQRQNAEDALKNAAQPLQCLLPDAWPLERQPPEEVVPVALDIGPIRAEDGHEECHGTDGDD